MHHGSVYVVGGALPSVHYYFSTMKGSEVLKIDVLVLETELCDF